MASFADVCCVLRVNARCGACKMKIMEILSAVTGVYSVDLDAEEGLVRVSGEVEASILMRALMISGRHAELVWAKIKHPVLSRSSHGHYDNGYASYSHGSYACLPCGCGSLSDPYYYTGLMSNQSLHVPLLSARYFPGYPTRAYGPYYY